MENSEHDYAGKAFAYARTVANIYPRGSATNGEARAAEYVRKQLDAIGIQDVRTQPFLGLRSIWLFLALALGFALVGHASYWLLSASIGIIPAGLISLACFGWSGLLLWRKFTFRSVPLVKSLPHGPSQNVLAVIPPTGDAKQKLVLISHMDSHRAVWLFATDTLVKFYHLSSPVSIYGVAAAPILYGLAELTGFTWIAYLGALIGLVHFIGWFTGMTADLGLYSPGANDNASAVGTLLGLAERLKQQPLQHTEIWLAFTGCEESGCEGMKALLAEHGSQLKGATFIDFEMVGIGNRLVYLRSEGVVRTCRISTDVERLLKASAGNIKFAGVEAAGIGAMTETGVAWEHGYKGACLSIQNEGSRLLPEWHRLTDRGERLQEDAFRMAHDYAWKLLNNIEAGI